jgi:hypothetical protein
VGRQRVSPGQSLRYHDSSSHSSHASLYPLPFLPPSLPPLPLDQVGSAAPGDEFSGEGPMPT